MALFVGLSHLRGSLEKVASKVDVLEVSPYGPTAPSPRTLRGWRKAVPPSFVFSVVLPDSVCKLERGKERDADLGRALDAATQLEARVVVLRTPPSVRPTAANRERLAAVLREVSRDGVIVAWEPSGLWEPEDVAHTARAVGAVPVFDAAVDPIPPGPIVYTRLRAIGAMRPVGPRTLDTVAQSLVGRREAFVIVEDKSQLERVKQGLASRAKPRRGGGASSMIVRPAVSMVAEDEEQ